MSGGPEEVRRLAEATEPVDLPEDLAAPHPDAEDGGWDGIDAGAPPPQDPGPGEAPPPEADCAVFPLNDFGNAQRLIRHFGEDLLSVARVGWHVWDGTRFVADPDGFVVRRLAHRLSDLIAREIWHLPLAEAEERALSDGAAAEAELAGFPRKDKDRSDDQRERAMILQQLIYRADAVKEKRDKSVARRLTHARTAGNSNGIKNLMVEAEAILARPHSDLDAGALDVNTLSGVLRFSTAMEEDWAGILPPRPVARVELVPHDRAQLLTKIMPVAYDPEARCPRWQAFLDRVQPVPEMQRFLRRWFGLSMTALTREQKFAFFYGSGANGKSICVETMAKIMGDYAASAKIESLTGKNRRSGGDATPDLVPMMGARAVRTSEPDEGQQLQEGLIKELTGGEPILIRSLNENFVLVYPVFKLTMTGNHRPEIRGGDDGIWRRVLLVPWDVQIPPAERVPQDQLVASFLEEGPGILNWLVEGLTDYLENGLGVPDTVLAATAEYREDSDPVGAFLTTCCALTGRAEDTIPAKELSEAVNFWLEDSGRGTWSPATVFKRLKAKAGRWKSPVTGKTFEARKASSSFYSGLMLAEPFATHFRAHADARGQRKPSAGGFDDAAF